MRGTIVSANTGGFLAMMFCPEGDDSRRVVLTGAQNTPEPLTVYLGDGDKVIDARVSFDELYKALEPLVKRKHKGV